MNLSLRAMNLYLSRFLFEGLGNVAKQTGSIANEAALIKMGQGKKAITDVLAREIEQKLGLPYNWMDRDNESLIRMSPQDYAIHKQVSILSEEAKRSLLQFISSMHVAK